MSKKQKLELTWVGKEHRPRLEPRILLEEPELSHYARVRNDEALFDNRLIQGDNLLALKALETEFAGQVKCVFIDPPYNTGSAFEHYDDGLEHSLWLGMMRDRLELIRYLLRNDGSLWVTLDDNEAHYFKVMCDEVFGRANFVNTVIWRKNYAPKSTARHLSEDHDYILVYAKNADIWTPNLMPRSQKQDSAYKNPDSDPRGAWKASDLSARNFYSLGLYPVRTPSGREIAGPPNGRYWAIAKEKFLELDAERRIWWGKNGDSLPQMKRFLSEVRQGVVPQTFWPYEEVGHTQEAKQESMNLFGSKNAFATPKPERLMQRILHLATAPGDLVLDSFAGSGTTGAVAHKMGRRWIMVELGEHARTHIVPRLHRVIDGDDARGITEGTGWKGGGGFRFYRLAPSLLEYDKWGREVISKAYNPEMLAKALCKLEGFIYAPSETEYWNHGHSTERDFIYVTTQILTHDQLRDLSEQVGPDRTLLVLCAAYRGDVRGLGNLTVKKLPDHVRDRCEWGRDDYSLAIEALPPAPERPAAASAARGTRADAAPDLFTEPAK